MFRPLYPPGNELPASTEQLSTLSKRQRAAFDIRRHIVIRNVYMYTSPDCTAAEGNDSPVDELTFAQQVNKLPPRSP
jgi:hypothetical protein